MGSSNDKINYNLRPSKSIERKMIFEVLREICPPRKANEYQYIGMGSAFFVDFKMFHKMLGINKMISFEGSESNVQRCNYNKPFECIQVVPERTERGLANVDWEFGKTVTWLDYENEIKHWMISDVETVVQNAKSGNVVIITLRRSYEKSNYGELNKDFEKYTLKKITPDDMHPKNSAKTLRSIFFNAIENKVRKAFAAYSPEDKLKFEILFEFTYEDGAQMYTFGGIFLNQADEVEFKTHKFHQFDFVLEENRPYNISCPIITNKEYHLMNSKLPANTLEEFSALDDLDIIPKVHRENYFRTYKYYPNYFELWV